MKKLYALWVVLIILFPFNYLNAQKEYNLWYFGYNAGIDFTSGLAELNNIMPLENGFDTPESCVTYSHPQTGELWFYTDGRRFFNKDDSIMPHGDGLLAGESASQGVLVVPRPNTENQFYIFTTDDSSTSVGLRYSLLDMSLDSGLGDIVSTEKNIYLHAPVIEGLTATKHANGVNYWVITHERANTNFLAFLVTQNGIEFQAKESPIGTNRNTPNSYIGYIKLSPNGQLLATTGWTENGFVDLFRFNNSTGYISDWISLPHHGWDWGLSFSPDNSTLYVATARVDNGLNSINRYDVSNYTSSTDDIGVTEKLVFKTWTSIGGLQIGPDRKIYVAINEDYYFGVINCPNDYENGCIYEEYGFNLDNRKSRWSPPNLIDDIFNTPPNEALGFSMTVTHPCIGNEGALNVVPFGGSPPYQFCIESISVCLDHVSNLGASFQNLPPSSYEIKMKDASGCSYFETVIIAPISPPVLEEVIITPPDCEDQNATIEIFATGSTDTLEYAIDPSSYSSSRIFNGLPIGHTTVYVRDRNHCVTTDVIDIEAIPKPQIKELESVSATCGNANGKIMIHAEEATGEVLYAIDDLPFSFSNTYHNLPPGIHSAYVQNVYGCVTTEDIIVEDSSTVAFESIVVSSTPCKDKNVGLTINLHRIDNKVTVLLNQDSARLVNHDLLPGRYNITIIEEEHKCEIDTTILIPRPKCRIYFPNVFRPGSFANPKFQVYAANGIEPNIKVYNIFNRWGGLIFESTNFSLSSSDHWWDGKFNGKIMDQGVYVYYIEIDFEDGTSEIYTGSLLLLK